MKSVTVRKFSMSYFNTSADPAEHKISRRT